MNRKKVSLIVAIALAAAALLTTAAALAGPPNPVLSAQNTLWQLTRVKVASPGQTTAMPEAH